MVIVKIYNAGGALLTLDVESKDIFNFLADANGESNAKNYLITLLSQGAFCSFPEWNQDSIAGELRINIPSLEMDYVMPQDKSNEHLSQELQTEPLQSQFGVSEEHNFHSSNQQTVDTHLTQSQNQCHEQTPNSAGPIHWSHDATLFLISQWKQFQSQFKNSTVRKDVLWRKIATNISQNGFGSPTSRQVEDKWKNLRKTYTKVKDNRGPNSSGAPTVNFKYYDEMDEIFFQSPAIQPPAIASSLRDNSFQLSPELSSGTNTSEGSSRKRKIDEYYKIFAEEQKVKTDILKDLSNATNVIAEKLDKLIEKL